MATEPYSDATEDVLDAYDADPAGLSSAEAEQRLAAHGENDIVRGGERSVLDILIAQFDSVLIWVLVAAALLSVWAGHAVDAVLIAVIVLANGVFGFVQDYRAEQSLEALRDLAAPTATVLRDGERVDVAATSVVPGDVLVIGSGDVVPADARVIVATDFEVDEAPLTGESMPVAKGTDPVDADTLLAERESMVYKGTNATRGKAQAVVTATGMDTEVGNIARELASTEETSTPLQVELDRLGRTLGLGVMVLSVLVAPLLLWRGTEPIQAALTAVSLAVAAVPEGLPAVVTLTLALGVRQMAEENALVRRLPSVEALGAVDVICTDKTGTLTRGEMTVERGWVHDETIDLAGEDAVETMGERAEDLLRIGAVCNDADPADGEPTELALVEVAQRHGIDVPACRSSYPREGEMPFSSDRKWMGTVHPEVGYVKGAPEVVLANSDLVLTADGPVALDAAERERIEAATNAFADDALRVLAMAYVEDPAGVEDLEDDLVFVGLVGMLDPPRPEVADAVAATKRAGIGVKMVTGDNVRTARAIGERLGFASSVLDGSDLEAMDDDELADAVEDVDVFARTSPEHKVRILRALKGRGHRVAMTGDGVNDAPALQNADVGVAMGIRGTDVARQAADVVLLDDNFATIERAIERGRAIFDNVWKFVAYLLSANVAEVLLVFIASLFGYLILPAVQLLWINLLTDGLPALALGVDPKGGDVMERPPRDPDRGIVGPGMRGVIAGMGLSTTAVVLGLMWYTLDGAASTTAYAMTMVFTGFVILEFGKLYAIRWMRETPTLSNPWLAGAVGASLVLQLAVLYTPLNEYFGTVPLAIGDWAVLGVALLVALPAYVAVARFMRGR